MSTEAEYLRILATVETGRRFTADDVRGLMEAAQLNAFERGDKACNKCHQSLPVDEFSRDAKAKDGLANTCRECHRRYHARPEVKAREHERHMRGKRARPLFDIWRGIQRRCLDEGDPAWRWYGGRGISIHPEWQETYAAFEAGVRAEIGARPSRLHSIDRIDTDGHYEPGNIRWADAKMQNANRRDNQWVTFNSQVRLSAHWAREYGILPSTFANRLNSGWDVERALTTPPRPIRTKKRVRAVSLEVA